VNEATQDLREEHAAIETRREHALGTLRLRLDATNHDLRNEMQKLLRQLYDIDARVRRLEETSRQ